MKKLISHRGNIQGKKPDFENHPEYIEYALYENYNVEVDVWYKNNSFYLGHDEPTYEIDFSNFILKHHHKLWLHCKNAEALEMLNHIDVDRYENYNYFWHENDKYTITSTGYIWVYPNEKLLKNSICVLPELYVNEPNLDVCYGICSDYIVNYKNK